LRVGPVGVKNVEQYLHAAYFPIERNVICCVSDFLELLSSSIRQIVAVYFEPAIDTLDRIALQCGERTLSC
jgi:hypothetical protein